jgi:hypothetical protein
VAEVAEALELRRRNPGCTRLVVPGEAKREIHGIKK